MEQIELSLPVQLAERLEQLVREKGLSPEELIVFYLEEYIRTNPI